MTVALCVKIDDPEDQHVCFQFFREMGLQGLVYHRFQLMTFLTAETPVKLVDDHPIGR